MGIISTVFAGIYLVGFTLNIPFSIMVARIVSKVNKKIENAGYEKVKSSKLRDSLINTLFCILPILNMENYIFSKKLLKDEKEFNNHIEGLLENSKIVKRIDFPIDRIQIEIEEFHKDPYKGFKEAGISKEEAIKCCLENISRINKGPATKESIINRKLWTQILKGYKAEEEPIRTNNYSQSNQRYRVRTRQIKKARIKYGYNKSNN